jgi:BirA family biotin operon repressor/biotin-[acetyl-CoA-carboxylase] ligase
VNDVSTFDLERIKTETFVRHVVYEPTMTSTNDRARSLAAATGDAPGAAVVTPCLVLTERQTAGRGRASHRWWSDWGSLTFSVLVREELDNLPAERWPTMSLVSALAVIDALTEPLRPVPLGLRWPNDVYADGRKICGILPERVGPPGNTSLVLGIGINVNNRTDGAPEELRSLAISMIEATGASSGLTEILIRVLQRIQRYLLRLAAADDQLSVEWNERSLLTGTRVRLGLGGTTVEGTCRGIDQVGRILLETAHGLQAYASGAVARSFSC